MQRSYSWAAILAARADHAVLWKKKCLSFFLPCRRLTLLTDHFHVLTSSSTDEREQEEEERPSQELRPDVEKEELPLQEEEEEGAKEEVVDKEEEMEVDGEMQPSHSDSEPPPS